MNLKKAKRILSALVYLMILFLVLGVFLNMRPLFFVCIAVAVVYTILYMKLWRCPHCGALLSRTGGTRCLSCEKDVGVKLRIP